MRPVVDFNAYSPVKNSSDEIINKAELIALDLGINVDNYNSSISRKQQASTYGMLKDSIPELPKAARLQKSKIPLTYWQVNFNDNGSSVFQDGNMLFSNSPITFNLHDEGGVFEFKVNTDHNDATFVQGDSLLEIGAYIISEIFGQSLYNYELEKNIPDTLLSTDPENASESQTLTNAGQRSEYDVTWVKQDLSKVGPIKMVLKLAPKVQLLDSSATASSGVKVLSLKSFYIDEKLELEANGVQQTILTYIGQFSTIILLICMVLIIGLFRIFKGMVDWKRAFVMLFIAIIVTGLWRGLYLMQSQGLFTDLQSSLIFIFNTLLYALVLGLFAALAYMTWESLARKQNHRQIRVIDAIWEGHVLFKETGSAILYGYSLSGILLGLLGVGLFGLNLNYFQFDSSFGYVEATSVAPYLSIPLNAISVVIFGVIAQVGVTSATIKHFIKSVWIKRVLTIMTIGFLFSGVGRFFGTEGSMFEDFLLYTLLAIPIYGAYVQFGLLTIAMAWWSFAMIIYSIPYFTLSSTGSLINFFIILGFYLLPLVIGFIARYSRNSVEQAKKYIPEYEEKLARSLRFEKEIEIARESQFQLLPVNTPELPEAMICGFFIPSFEVGGDYYDYFIKNDEDGKAKSLAITVVDVSGKAMKAAMHAIHTSGLILSRLDTDTPEKVLTSINPFIHTKTDKRTFITAVIAEYFFENKVLRIANAGHCMPIIKREGKANFVETPGNRYPLGIRPSVEYDYKEIQLVKDDLVLFYSDGLPEAANTKGERFGFDTVLKLIEDLDDQEMDSSKICQSVKRSIQTFSSYQMADDTTIVALKIE